MEINERKTSSEEIDFLKILQVVIIGRRTIIKFTLVSVLLGIVFAFCSEDQYSSSTIIVSQNEKAKVGGNLGGLAAMAGINLGRSNTESISPSLYSIVGNSISFKRELLKTSLNIEGLKRTISYKEYYDDYKKTNVLSFIKDYTIGLPSKILNLFKKNSEFEKSKNDESIYRLTKKENRLFKQLSKQLFIDYDKKDEYVKISFLMPEPLMSAQMAKKSRELLQTTIINYKLEVNQEELKFVEARYLELKEDFEKKQLALASFRDENQGLISSRSQSILQNLEAEYNLSFTLFSEMAKQFETQRIKVKEDTPVFTIIEPVVVPVERSSPKRIKMIFVFSFFGFFVGVIYISLKPEFIILKKRLIKN